MIPESSAPQPRVNAVRSPVFRLMTVVGFLLARTDPSGVCGLVGLFLLVHTLAWAAGYRRGVRLLRRPGPAVWVGDAVPPVAEAASSSVVVQAGLADSTRAMVSTRW